MRARAELVRFFDFEPELLSAVAVDDRQVARERVVVETAVLAAGAVDLDAFDEAERTVGVLLLDGVLVHRFKCFGRGGAEVLGEGDVVRPEGGGPGHGPVTGSWHAQADLRVALLGSRFQRDVARWPAVVGALIDRIALRQRSLAVQLAIAQMPNLELRLLSLLWSFADRWGTVGTDGVSLELPVAQEVLAELVSARRPSVNTALRRLRERDLVVQLRPGRWRLAGGCPHADAARAALSAS